MINVACVLWGSAYSAHTVLNLYNQVKQNLSVPFRFCIFTESSRAVSSNFTKIDLPVLPECAGWWYKIAIFNPDTLVGPTLYLDLDIVITGSLDWIVNLPITNLTAIRNFDRLWNPGSHDFNSSVMWFDNNRHNLYQRFMNNPESAIRQYRGDQDWMTAQIPSASRRFFPEDQIVSYRWQCVGQGWDHERSCYRSSSQEISNHGASIVVFHGTPKPWDLDPVARDRLMHS